MTTKPRLLVVDDEQNIRRSLGMILGGAGFEVFDAATGEDALASLGERAVDAVFLDVMLPGIDGIETLRRLRVDHPDLPVVMISGHATIERAVEATRLGAFDFVEKPFSRERILTLARNACRTADAASDASADDMIGRSEVMQRLREQIDRVARTDARVLLRGESGTGKELVAKRLHDRSARAGKPFVKVNCAAIPEELIEGELFGAVKGAYTGADADREGRFAAADGGTLLLDEIGDMSPRAQVKVLRVLQEGEFEPVGSTTTRSVDVRVVAATHQHLEDLVQQGRFREDLYFRLNVIPLHVPALRERPGDVEELVGHFLHEESSRYDVTPPRITEPAMARLARHAWPGNIRELRNVVERLVVLHAGGTIGVDALPFELNEATPSTSAAEVDTDYTGLPLKQAKERFERELIEAALARHDGNVTHAARDLGLERTHLHKRIRALGIGQDGA
ncbi:MAG TPA: sigma-54 dependent transcriptional regulator [Candidatus Krumholzibacteria bacterium]|nr:sigma-54 dependent transcriptional regulator [Candidatus Krumholzibacteria bacterium]